MPIQSWWDSIIEPESGHDTQGPGPSSNAYELLSAVGSLNEEAEVEEQDDGGGALCE